MKTALVIMAAGIGSRFGGGIKQLAAVGPNGEIIMDYSIHDAIEAGFDKIVFIIRHDIEDAFKEAIGDRIEKICAELGVEIDYAFQALENVPAGYSVPEGRSKPWGTGQAVLACKGIIKEPFAVINADDFYGRNGFEVLARFLAGTDGTGQYCMVGYRVGNTLSESGSVSRGVCETDTDGFLTSVTERTEIRRQEGRGIIFRDEQDEYHALAPETPVSMNMWGFTPDYMDFSARLFARFLAERGHELKSEFYIPTVVNEAIRCGAAKVKVLDTDASWFGVTYAADRPGVVEKIRDLVDAGEYPEQLW